MTYRGAGGIRRLFLDLLMDISKPPPVPLTDSSKLVSLLLFAVVVVVVEVPVSWLVLLLIGLDRLLRNRLSAEDDDDDDDDAAAALTAASN
jgi:hypothetical protein